MDRLNYHHLYYFWRIQQDGGIAKAAARLRLSHSTLSVQLAALEAMLGAALFERKGRRLSLTPLGVEISAYAAEIFRLGTELVEVAGGQRGGRRSAFRIGVVHSLPKTFTLRILRPVLHDEEPGRIVVRQGELDLLLAELAANRLHVVLSDTPPSQAQPPRLHAHLLGESPVLLYGAPKLAARYRPGFPQSMDDAPLLLPGPTASLRRGLERWLSDRGIRVRVQGEIDDAEMLRVLGGEGRGLFPVRAGLRSEVEEGYGAELIGELEGVSERYYAISLERRIRHPDVAALIDVARAQLAIGDVAAAARPARRSRRARRE